MKEKEKEVEKVDETKTINNDNGEKKDIINEKKDYNINQVEEKDKSLEAQVNEEQDKKYLAKTIVDLKEENTQIKNMLAEILGKLRVNTNDFTDSQVSSTNGPTNSDEDSKYFIKINK